MKNVSSAFREELKKDNRNYIKSADITLKSGTVLKIDNSDLWQNGMKLDTATSNPNSFDLGAIITGQLTLTLNNIDEKFSDYDFTDCTATNVKVGLKLPDGTTESLSYGKFYLNEAKYNGSIITLTFYDSIYKFDRPYSKSSLSYPATLRQIVQDACSVCGVTQGTFTFDQDDFVVQERPDDSSITFRQVLQWVGQISCQYFYADVQGRLRMAWYDVGLLDSLVTDVEEGFLQDTAGEYVLDHNSEKINTLKLLSEPDDDVEESPYDDTMFHEIESFTSLTTGLDDVVITGIRIIQEVDSEDGGKENITIQYGTDGYVLGIEGNKFITEENASDVAAMVGIKTIGMQFRSFSANALSDPTIEPGDVVLLIDRKRKRYKSIVTNNTFHPGNFQAFSCGAKSPIRNSSTRFSQITQVYTDYRKELSQQRTAIETALAELDDRIENSSGLFTTIEEQPDGSKKYFLHDKPLLSDSEIVWSMTAEAWGVSTDGGQTQNAGMTVDGDTIVRILTAVGVNADWIKTGAFRIEKDGEVMFSADTETGIIDIVANSFTLKGKSIDDIAEDQVNDFVDSVYTPAIDNIQKQIDGQIETYYYDYEPTLENVPAIDWTSEEERRSHEGDLFYWKSRGYAYRFFKDGDTWKWQMVQDTDITKALEQAAEAKDTADQKRRVFVVTPYPPYDVGDLWVGNNTSDLMRCQRSRSSGSYNADDWIKAVKYTDDTELNNFIREDYSETIQEIYNSVDKKAQTWYQTTDPSLDWASIEESVLQDTDGNSILDSENNDIITLWEKEKSTHDGDLWKNPTNNKEYMYVDGEWVEMSIPDDLFDTIDGKAQIFVVQPTPPYAVGDVWFTGTTILVCDTARESGEFNANDWTKRDNYTDDSALYEFIEGDYASTIDELQTQSDKKAETWYQANDPSTHWNADEKLKHDGDLWYNTSSQKTYIYNGSAWEETKSNPPDEVFDTIDGKAQIFVRQPVTPYAVGDLWFDSASSDIMTCIYSRESGNFNAGDWQKRNKYTDDSYAQEINAELNEFISNYQDEITEIQSQIDKKAETWYQSTDPSLQWTDTESDQLQDTTGASIFDTTGATIVTIYESEKALHDGDLWHDTTNNKEYIYVDGEWQETSIPDDVFDIIDGKAQIFVSTPTPPYAIGDLWFNSATSDIMTCINGRESGSYASSDWQKRNKYTDDSYAEEVAGDLSNFADQVVGDLENMQTQIDGKIETYYYDYQPTLTNIPASAWTTETERQKHVGDLFYYKSTGFTYRFLKDGSTWKWQAIKDSDIDEALQQAATAQDTADGKRRVFTSTPTPPYDVGDLWAQGGSGDIMRCIVARSSGSYVSTDWDKASKYTDDTAVGELDSALDKQGVFDRLTNYGEVKGIFLESDGQLYINASYLMTGILKVAQPGASGKETFYANMDTGEVRIVANSFSLTNGDTIDSIAQGAVDDLDDSLTQTDIFNRLTGNKANEAIILQNGHIYINASYLNTGILQVSTASGTETLYVNVDTGEVRINATSFSLTDGRTIDSIADNAKSEAIQYTDERLSDYDPADDLTQQEVFNILTNGGITQGIYLNGGRVYVNASYIGAGTLDADRIDAKGLTVYNASGTRTLYIDNNGNVSINANSLMLSGTSVNSIANNAANSALQDAKDYTDLQIENFDPDLTQQEVFNILTNGGTTQGIYLSGGKIYINAAYIGSGIISASRIASSSISAGLITADKISISDLRSLSATIGGITIGSQGLSTSNGLLRFYNDGRIVFNNRVTLEAEGNGMSIRTGLTIYSSSGGDFGDGTGLINFRGIGSTTGGTYLVAQGNLNSIAKRSSSSKRYKDHIRDLDDEEALSILDIPVVVFKYKDGYLVKGDLLEGKPIPGFYAEDVEEVAPILCQYNLDGSVEDWNYRTMIPYMLKTMQIQQKQIDNLQTQINELKTMILNMKGAQ